MPRQVLSKADSLTGDEWRLIYRHPIVSERTPQGVSACVLKQAAHLTRDHHEHWNGSGYPDDLAGEQIPFGARIIHADIARRCVWRCAVVDAFVTMTANLLYQRAQSRPVALAKLRRGSGAQLDPDVVETACRAMSSWAGKLVRNGDTVLDEAAAQCRPRQNLTSV